MDDTFDRGDDGGDSEPKLLPSGLRALSVYRFSHTDAASNSKRRPIVFSAWFEGIYASGIMTVLS